MELGHLAGLALEDDDHSNLGEPAAPEAGQPPRPGGFDLGHLAGLGLEEQAGFAAEPLAEPGQGPGAAPVGFDLSHLAGLSLDEEIDAAAPLAPQPAAPIRPAVGGRQWGALGAQRAGSLGATQAPASAGPGGQPSHPQQPAAQASPLHDGWVPPGLGDEIRLDANQGQVPPVGPQPGGQVYGGGSAVGDILGALIKLPAKAATTLAAAVAKRSHQARAKTVRGVEESVAEAILASEAAVKALKAFREHPDFAPIDARISAAARTRGVPANDVVKDMTSSGRHADLWTDTQAALANGDLQRLHERASTAMAEQSRCWTAAIDQTAAAEVDYHSVWQRLSEQSEKLAQAGQGLPAEEGQSFAEFARSLVERLAAVVRRAFRIGGNDASVRPGTGGP